MAYTVVAIVFTSLYIAASACMTASLSGVHSTFLSKEYVAVMIVLTRGVRTGCGK